MEFEAGEKDPKDGQILPQEKQVTLSPIHENVHPEKEENPPAERVQQNGLTPTPLVEAENTADISQLDNSKNPITTIIPPSSAHIASDDDAPLHWRAIIAAAVVCLIAGVILILVWAHEH